MDWKVAIERNSEALKRILAMLVAMAGGDRPATLPRHLHRAVLALLRPAEASARRLIIVVARGLVVELPAARPRKPKPPRPDHAALRRFGVAVVLSPAQIAAEAQAARAAAAKAAARAARPPRMSLPLFDSLPHLSGLSKGRRHASAHAVPRILFPGVSKPSPIPVRRPPSPQDPIDATRLALRLSALGRALDDLPAQARRFARWRARRDAGRVRRVWPLRPGSPPGGRRRPVHEVHQLLNDVHGLAFWVLNSPDTS